MTVKTAEGSADAGRPTEVTSRYIVPAPQAERSVAFAGSLWPGAVAVRRCSIALWVIVELSGRGLTT